MSLNQSETHKDLNGIKTLTKIGLLFIGAVLTLISALVLAGVVGIFAMAKDVSALKTSFQGFNQRLGRVETFIDDEYRDRRTR